MIRSLISEIKEFKNHRFWLPCSWSLKSCLRFRFPLSWRVFLDQGVQQRNMNNILFYGGLMLVCAFCSLFVGCSLPVMAPMHRLVLLKPSSGHFQKVQTFSFENIDQFSSGGLVTRMMTDVTNVQNAYQMVIRICVRAPLN